MLETVIANDRVFFEHTRRVGRNEAEVALEMFGNGPDPEKVINEIAGSYANKVLAPRTLAI